MEKYVATVGTVYVLRSMETVLESDERTMGKPVSEIGWIFDKIHEWKEILSKLEI